MKRFNQHHRSALIPAGEWDFDQEVRSRLVATWAGWIDDDLMISGSWMHYVEVEKVVIVMSDVGQTFAG